MMTSQGQTCRHAECTHRPACRSRRITVHSWLASGTEHSLYAPQPSPPSPKPKPKAPSTSRNPPSPPRRVRPPPPKVDPNLRQVNWVRPRNGTVLDPMFISCGQMLKFSWPSTVFQSVVFDTVPDCRFPTKSSVELLAATFGPSDVTYFAIREGRFFFKSSVGRNCQQGQVLTVRGCQLHCAMHLWSLYLQNMERC
jgi:hypothetical protein